MPFNKKMMEILVCPKCKGELELTAKEDNLLCHVCKLAYPIRENGIPCMIIDEAQPIKDESAPTEPPPAEPVVSS